MLGVCVCVFCPVALGMDPSDTMEMDNLYSECVYGSSIQDDSN